MVHSWVTHTDANTDPYPTAAFGGRVVVLVGMVVIQSKVIHHRFSKVVHFFGALFQYECSANLTDFGGFGRL